MDNNLKIFKAPRFMQADKIELFLDSICEIFTMKDKLIPNVCFDVSNVESIDILGALTIYKFMEYVSKHNCCYRPKAKWGKVVEDNLGEYGFLKLLNDYLSKKRADYDSLRFMTKNKFFIAPLALLREENYSKDKLVSNFHPQIEAYYSHIPKASAMVFQCLSEVLINFWEHATDDTKSILVAKGSKDFVEIACADTGEGIITTLGPTLGKGYTNTDILVKALEKGITSKQHTDHMGCGLWVLDELVSKAKGKLYLFSEGSYYKRTFGNKSVGICPYWKGTIVYLFLPLSSPATIADLDDYDINDLDEIKINTL